ncbi:hypothetical protein T492DRAFT_1050164 [Pavlovales sp. CCMP2436]|nr:hypothetical protein T492DRAFT_1050164 [Pavlovales sp. CCMP2436]
MISRRAGAPLRSRIVAPSVGGEPTLKDDVNRLKEETTLLRSELAQIEELNEMARPRRKQFSAIVASPVAPTTDGDAESVGTKVELPFGLRIEAQLQNSDERKKNMAGAEEEPFIKFDLETTRLQPFGRFIATLPYVLPLCDALFLVPANEVGLDWFPYLWVARFVAALPYASVILFFVCSIASQQMSLPFALRYNLRQAILLDITAISFQLLFSFAGGFVNAEAVKDLELVGGAVFYAILLAVTYSQACNLMGILPKGIPVISSTADNMSGPRF